MLSVWDHSWPEIWLPLQALNSETADFERLLSEHDFPEDYEPHDDLLAELYRELFEALAPEVRKTIDRPKIISNYELASQYFQLTKAGDFDSELSAVRFFESAYDVLCEFDDLLACRYSVLLQAFIRKYNLRYRLKDSGEIIPTLPGIFSSLFDQLSCVSSGNLHLEEGLRDLENSLSDFNSDQSEARIRACILRLMNLLEAIASGHPSVMEPTSLGKVCKALTTWPHTGVQQSLTKLYGFASNYPGIRHAGNPATKKRNLGMRDFIALTTMLTAYIPYLTEELDCQEVYVPGSQATQQADQDDE